MKRKSDSFQTMYFKRILISSFLLLMSFPVYAFHPLITDDTGTQGKHNLGLEVAYHFEHDTYRWFDRSPQSVLEGLFGSVYTRDDASELGITLSYGIIDPLDVVIGFPS